MIFCFTKHIFIILNLNTMSLLLLVLSKRRFSVQTTIYSSQTNSSPVSQQCLISTNQFYDWAISSCVPYHKQPQIQTAAEWSRCGPMRTSSSVYCKAHGSRQLAKYSSEKLFLQSLFYYMDVQSWILLSLSHGKCGRLLYATVGQRREIWWGDPRFSALFGVDTED